MKKIYGGIVIAAAVFFTAQGVSFSEEIKLDVKDPGAAVIADTQNATDEIAAAVNDKKEEVKQVGEEATTVVLKGDTVPVPVADSKI